MKQVENFEDLFKQAKEDGSLDIEATKLRFAICLNKLMKAEGQTRAELAKKIGKSNAYITKVLRGDTNFTISSMVSLVKALEGKIDVVVHDKNGRVIKSAENTKFDATISSEIQSWTLVRARATEVTARQIVKMDSFRGSKKRTMTTPSGKIQILVKRDYENGKTLLAA